MNHSVMQKISLALVGVLSVGAIATSTTALVLGGKHNGWFEKAPVKEQEQTEVLQGESGFEVGEINKSAKMSLMSSKVMTPDNAASVMLTAEVLPADTLDKTVKWLVEWDNPNSTWARGKTVTDYVTVTPTTEGALTATVTNKKAFGERIKVTVTSNSNSEASASCMFDYAKKIIDMKLSGGLGTMDGDSFWVNTDVKGQDISLVPTYSEYTKEDDFTSSVQYKHTSEFLNAVKNNGFSGASNTSSYKNFSLTKRELADFLCDDLNMGSGAYVFYARTGESWNNMVKALKAMNNAPIGTLKVTYTGTYSTSVYEIDIVIPANDLATTATSVNLNQNNYIF